MNEVVAALTKLVPSFKPNVIFDVGANVGQSSNVLSAAYPNAAIHAFEPVKATAQKLRENLRGKPNVVVHELAFGVADGHALITAHPLLPTNSMVDADRKKEKHPTEEIRVFRGDTFCKDNELSGISYLKIDTEGNDLNALVGFVNMLRDQQIDFVQVEAGMNSLNRRHTNMSSFIGFLEPLSYKLFHVVEQFMQPRNYYMRRSNLVFVSDRVSMPAVN